MLVTSLVAGCITRLNVIFIGQPDEYLDPSGVECLGKVGVSAAIANAVFHATGKRLRGLPIMSDRQP